MKIALAFLCSLMLVWAQVAAAAIPVTQPVPHDCGCHGKMACCRAPAAPAAPPDTTAPAATQNQLVSPVPATVVWVLTAAGTPSFCPVSTPSWTAAVAPIFARNCIRLI